MKVKNKPKFIINEQLRYYHNDRVVIENGSPAYLCSIYIQTTKDFDIDDEFVIISNDSNSVQFRPKSIYFNTLGYYYKMNSNTIYLDDYTVKEMKKFIIKAKKHIESLC